jgi:hypothetical protein
LLLNPKLNVLLSAFSEKLGAIVWANRIENWKYQLEAGNCVAWTGLVLAIVSGLLLLTIEILKDFGSKNGDVISSGSLLDV